MDRLRAQGAATRTLAQFNASRDLESTIAEAIAAWAGTDAVLHQAVQTYVSEERHSGTSLGVVIQALTKLVEKSHMTAPQPQALTRRVVLWCEAAYCAGGIGTIPVAERDDNGRERQLNSALRTGIPPTEQPI
jgi:hypothetical protein